VCGFYADRHNTIVRENTNWAMNICPSRTPSAGSKPQIFRNCADISIGGSGGGGTKTMAIQPSEPAEEPMAEEPAGEEPVGEEPVGEEPVGEEPAGEEPVNTGTIGTDAEDDDTQEETSAVKGATNLPKKSGVTLLWQPTCCTGLQSLLAYQLCIAGQLPWPRYVATEGGNRGGLAVMQ
jgi:hypothetical protein